MTETIQIWLFAGGFGLIAVLFGLHWNHAKQCKAVGEAIARIDQSLKDLNDNVRPQLELLRERSHDQQGAILKQDGRIAVLEVRR